MRTSVKGGDCMGLRTILYGYRKEQFEFYIVPEEAEIVKTIFNEYLGGKTLLEIANSLTNKGIVYYQDKTIWSKQAVRRILENSHYLGDADYPQIIDKETYEKANKMRLNKGGEREKDTEEISYLKKHMICDCCGKNFSRKSHYKNRERWLCLGGCKATKEYLDDPVLFAKINAVIKLVKRNPCLLFLDESEEIEQECTLTREFLRKERDVRNLMNDMNSSLQSVKKLLFDLQTEKFSNLKPVLSGEYTDELIMLVSEFPVKKEGIDIEFLRQTISKIIVQADGNIRIRFVNGKEIGNELEVAR